MATLADQWLCADCLEQLDMVNHGPVYSEATSEFVECCSTCLSRRVSNMGLLAIAAGNPRNPSGLIAKAWLTYFFLRLRRRPKRKTSHQVPEPAPMRPVAQLHTSRAARNKAKRQRRKGHRSGTA